MAGKALSPAVRKLLVRCVAERLEELSSEIERDVRKALVPMLSAQRVELAAVRAGIDQVRARDAELCR